IGILMDGQHMGPGPAPDPDHRAVDTLVGPQYPGVGPGWKSQSAEGQGGGARGGLSNKIASCSHASPYLMAFILMFLKLTRSPWSCKRMGPLVASPKLGQSTYLLPATNSLKASLPLSYSNTFMTLSQCSTWPSLEMIWALFHSPMGWTGLSTSAWIRS